MQCSNKTITFIGAEHINGTSSLSFSEAHVEALRYRTTMYWSCTFTKEKVEETYLNLAGENTPIQSSAVGLGLPISTVTHSESSPCRQKKQGKEEPGKRVKKELTLRMGRCASCYFLTNMHKVSNINALFPKTTLTLPFSRSRIDGRRFLSLCKCRDNLKPQRTKKDGSFQEEF